jgi:hypothetical protein
MSFHSKPWVSCGVALNPLHGVPSPPSGSTLLFLSPVALTRPYTTAAVFDVDRRHSMRAARADCVYSLAAAVTLRTGEGMGGEGTFETACVTVPLSFAGARVVRRCTTCATTTGDPEKLRAAAFMEQRGSPPPAAPRQRRHHHRRSHKRRSSIVCHRCPCCGCYGDRCCCCCCSYAGATTPPHLRSTTVRGAVPGHFLRVASHHRCWGDFDLCGGVVELIPSSSSASSSAASEKLPVFFIHAGNALLLPSLG